MKQALSWIVPTLVVALAAPIGTAMDVENPIKTVLNLGGISARFALPIYHKEFGLCSTGGSEKAKPHHLTINAQSEARPDMVGNIYRWERILKANPTLRGRKFKQIHTNFVGDGPFHSFLRRLDSDNPKKGPTQPQMTLSHQDLRRTAIDSMVRDFTPILQHLEEGGHFCYQSFWRDSIKTIFGEAQHFEWLLPADLLKLVTPLEESEPVDTIAGLKMARACKRWSFWEPQTEGMRGFFEALKGLGLENIRLDFVEFDCFFIPPERDRDPGIDYDKIRSESLAFSRIIATKCAKSDGAGL